MDKEKVVEILKELINKDKIDQEIEIRKLSEECGITKRTLTKQLEEYKSEIINKENEEKNQRSKPRSRFVSRSDLRS